MHLFSSRTVSTILISSLAGVSAAQNLQLEFTKQWNYGVNPVKLRVSHVANTVNGELIALSTSGDIFLQRLDKNGNLLGTLRYDQPGGGLETIDGFLPDATGSVYVLYRNTATRLLRLAKFSSQLVRTFDMALGTTTSAKLALDANHVYVADLSLLSAYVVRKYTQAGAPVFSRLIAGDSSRITDLDVASPRITLITLASGVSQIRTHSKTDGAALATYGFAGGAYSDVMTHSSGAIYGLGTSGAQMLRTVVSPAGVASHQVSGTQAVAVRSRLDQSVVYILTRDGSNVVVEQRSLLTDALQATFTRPGQVAVAGAISRDGKRLGVAYAGPDGPVMSVVKVDGLTEEASIPGDFSVVSHSGFPGSFVAIERKTVAELGEFSVSHVGGVSAWNHEPEATGYYSLTPIKAVSDAAGNRYVVVALGNAATAYALAKYNAAGQVLWSRGLYPNRYLHYHWNLGAAADGSVTVAADNGATGTFVRRYAANGSVIYDREFAARFSDDYNDLTVSPDGSTYMVLPGTVVRLDPAGNVVWSQVVSEMEVQPGIAALPNGDVGLALVNRDTLLPEYRVLGPSGNLKWKRILPYENSAGKGVDIMSEPNGNVSVGVNYGDARFKAWRLNSEARSTLSQAVYTMRAGEGPWFTSTPNGDYAVIATKIGAGVQPLRLTVMSGATGQLKWFRDLSFPESHLVGLHAGADGSILVTNATPITGSQEFSVAHYNSVGDLVETLRYDSNARVVGTTPTGKFYVITGEYVFGKGRHLTMRQYNAP